MLAFSHVWHSHAARAGCAHLLDIAGEVEQDAIAIQQIAAPTFAEHKRGRWVARRLQALGFAEVEQDEAGNVLARLPGQAGGPALLVSAHLDTVFPAGTDLSVRREEGLLWGPGIGDNSLGVAGLLALADTLRRVQATPRRDVWFAANVGEEGLGNLSGMWRVVRRLQPKVGAVVVLEGGAFGVVVHRGIGVQRRRLIVETNGGHAWSDFGEPSAIHELCRVGAAIAGLSVPEEPRTSFNLGTIEGGTSINTIAASASALLDMRSVEPHALQALAAEVDRILAGARREGVTVRHEPIGERPAGNIRADHPLVMAALESLRWVGHAEPKLRAASTDANVPMSLGIPTVCIGLTMGHNAHRLDEYVELAPLREGLQHSFLTLLAALEWLS